MEAYFALTQPTQVNKVSSSCEICRGPHDTQYYMENPEQAFVDYTSSHTNKVGGKRFTPNQGPNNFNDAANTWNKKPNFNWAHTQTFTSPQSGSITVYSSSYQVKLEKALLDFDSDQEKRLSHLRTQLGQQQDDMIGKINILWKNVFEKLSDASTFENTGNSMDPKSIATISYAEKEELKKKGIKSPSKLFSQKYLSPASIKELNKNPSSPKRVYFVNSIVILSTNNDTEEEHVLSTNAHEHELGNMVRRNEEVKEQGKGGDEMETNKEVEEVFKDKESKWETKKEAKEMFDDETKEEDNDTKHYNSLPTIKELVYHEWLLKNPQTSWVKAKIRAENPSNSMVSCMIRHILMKDAYIAIESLINIMSKKRYNQIMTYKLGPRKKLSNPNKISKFVGRVRGLRVFLGTLAYKCDFMILEDTTSVIDVLGEFVFEKPFIEETGLVYNKEEGTLAILVWAIRVVRDLGFSCDLGHHSRLFEGVTLAFGMDNEKISFKMPHTLEIFKQSKLKGLNTDSIPPAAYGNNFGQGITHYYQSLLIGDEYRHDKGDKKGIRHLMKLEKKMMEDQGEVT
nr:protein kinase-like domain, concanavalin A-like lectin/glucanase domain protein [Tanacetum cinerariifolium]